MTRLPFDDYLQHLAADSARLRDVLAGCDPDARVPGCPDWSARDLLGHHAGVLQFWADIVEQRPAGPGEDWVQPEPPTSYDDRLAHHEQQEGRLLAALAGADPAEPAWTWSAEQTVGFTYRRQAHEALIHRVDAEQTAGLPSALDPVLATDGVEEALAVMYGGTPAWGTFTGDGRLVRVDVVDTDASIWVELGRFAGTDPDSGTTYDEVDISVIAPPEQEPDVVLEGQAGALDAWLWRRGDDDALVIAGDREVYDAFRGVVDQAID